MAADGKIERNFHVRFAQVDGARVIYYPRYLEMIADTFPEAALEKTPYELSIRFSDSNRLGDNIRMVYEPDTAGWRVSGMMEHEHFSISLARIAERGRADEFRSDIASFQTEPAEIRDWMCGPGGELHLSRYYELISHTVEQWFETSLGMGFNELHVKLNLGIPTVQLETRCQALPRSGETVSMALRPISVGGSAVQLMTWLTRSGVALLETRQVIVFVELDDQKIRSVRIPEMLQRSMRSQLAVAASQ